ncbi:MAG: hypothetical protein IMW92_12190 [Bacillales bacterium]|nr:hypothetical protein [Bacillales bacterium]
MGTILVLIIVIVGTYLYNMFVKKAKTPQKQSSPRNKTGRTAGKSRPLLAKELDPDFVHRLKRKEGAASQTPEAKTASEIKAATLENPVTMNQNEWVKGIILGKVLGPSRAKRSYFS